MAAILAIYIVLSFLYLRATPPLEPPDESGHMAFIFHLKQYRALPVSSLEDRSPTRTQEYTQPPLYYLLGALLTAPIDTAGHERHYRMRPDAPLGRADIPGPKNAFIPHGRTSLPYERPIRALMLMRLFSMLLGAGTILLVGRSVRLLAPERPETAAWAAALTAFNPMFLFISNSVNNDNLVTFLVTAAMAWMIARYRRLCEPRQALVLGALTGLALSTKLSALVLLPVIGWTLGRMTVPFKDRVRALATVCGVAFALSAAWLIRNVRLYGDPFGTRMHTALTGNARAAWAPLALLREWDGFVKSFWGVFGAFNVIYRDGVYYAFYALTALGLASIIAWFVRYRGRFDRRAESLAALALCNVAAVAVWTSRLMGSQGRLLFPSLLGWTGLFAISVAAWPPTGRRIVQGAVVFFLLATALWGALAVIPEQYP